MLQVHTCSIALVVSRPMPELAPVTMATFPRSSGGYTANAARQPVQSASNLQRRRQERGVSALRHNCSAPVRSTRNPSHQATDVMIHLRDEPAYPAAVLSRDAMSCIVSANCCAEFAIPSSLCLSRALIKLTPPLCQRHTATTTEVCSTLDLRLVCNFILSPVLIVVQCKRVSCKLLIAGRLLPIPSWHHT